MPLPEGITALELRATVMGGPVSLFPTLVHGDDEDFLIDTGYPGQGPLLLEAIRNAGVDPRRICRILLTHQDLDHIGAVNEILPHLATETKVFCGAREREFIEGRRLLEKITPATVEKAVAMLPPHVGPEQRAAFRFRLEHPPKVAIDEVLQPNQEYPWCGGLTVIPTEGHTSGHLSFYFRQHKVLVAGDALQTVDGRPVLPVAAYCTDFEKAVASATRLEALEVEAVLCHHGGPSLVDAGLS